MTVVDDIRGWAVRRPDHPALRVASRGEVEVAAISYGELLASADRIAGEIGGAVSASGCRIGLVAPQGAAFVESALGILVSGGCLVPIPDDQSESALREFVERARLHALVRGGDHTEIETFDPSFAHEQEFAALDPAYLRFTSGTTNERKGVVLSHQRVLERLSAANRGMAIFDDDRVLWLLPMAHHFVVSILLYLRNGATILLPSGSLAEPILDLCAETQPTVFYASPYHYNLLAKDASARRLDSVRLAVSTAEGLRADTAELFATRYGFELTQALGIIEVGLPVMNLDGARAKPTALGRALPNYDVWLRDDAGQPILETSSDHCGEVCIRGPGMFDAYLDPWTPSAEVLEPDGFRTGDQGWIDENGDVHLVGRRANRINMAGMKFFSEEVEAVLDRHPAVLASRVLAREHPRLGQIPVAEIVLRGDESPTTRQLTDFCREYLPNYKIPRQFRVVDALPMTATGKVRRV